VFPLYIQLSPSHLTLRSL